MKILAIETSCDETGIALVEAAGGLESPKFRVLRSLVASQVKIHAPYGGIVPNLAKREHNKNLPILLGRIMNMNKKLGIRGDDKTVIRNSKFIIPDMVAVTVGPGLEPCLWEGISFAKELHKQLKENNKRRTTKLVGVNHLEGHLYSFLLQSGIRHQMPAPHRREARHSTVPGETSGAGSDVFPAVQLLVSGGHTILVLMKSLTERKKLGETRDDAVGEAFDKVGRMLNLPFPGGPEIECLANETRKLKTDEAIPFPRPMIHAKNYDFSFSGLKTAVLYYLRDFSSTNNELSTNVPARQPLALKAYAGGRIRKFAKDSLFADVAAAFQQAAFDVLLRKTARAVEEFGAKTIILSGGVAANKTLRKQFRQMSNTAPRTKLRSGAGVNGQMFISAPPKYQTDNAAMIAAAAYISHLRGKKHPLKANGNLNL